MPRLDTKETGQVSSEIIAFFIIIPLSLGAKLTKMLKYENRAILPEDIRQSFYSEILHIRQFEVVFLLLLLLLLFKRVSGLGLSKSNVCRFL